MTPEEIVSFIQLRRFPLHNEGACQEHIEAQLSASGVAFQREFRLSARDIIDFMIGDVGVEVKLRGQPKREIYRQCERYCQHDRVKALVLVTNVSMGLPPVIAGKPTYFASLSRGWL